MPRKPPLYPHVPKGKGGEPEEPEDKLNAVVAKVEELVRLKGQLHSVDATGMAMDAGVSPTEVILRLAQHGIVEQEEYGVLVPPSTPVYYGSLGFELWTKLSTRYGIDDANRLAAKLDELREVAGRCQVTGPNGLFDTYNDFNAVLEQVFEHDQEVHTTPLMEIREGQSKEETIEEIRETFRQLLPTEVTEVISVVEEQVAETLRTSCGCRINGKHQ